MHSRACLTTNLVGGLGNQLFLVANLLATSRRNGVPAVLKQMPWSSSNEQPRPVYWQSIFEDLNAYGVGGDVPAGVPEVIVPEPRPVMPVKVDASVNCVYNMVGFFQSEAFFADCPVVRDALPSRLRNAAVQHLRENYGDPSTVQRVGLHIRRGDYLRMRDVFEILEVDYYDAAVRQLLGHSLHLQSMGGGCGVHLLVFCEEERYGSSVVGYFRSKYPGLEASLVHAAAERVPFECGSHAPREVLELLMLSGCEDVVMSNSTWSWWAAYFNECPLRRVVSPARWFVQHPYPQSNHLYRKDWILL
ncbi:glycoside hydrolase family protein [Trypanosoma rangeli]|uniref:Glycoside hydrolase family protein n=1 Tax=Trypanosoma rangeli TaxID=5698 RepID=A0A422NY61_TRYRA|nr:glycoside hydrolase family protein [Trypanosoma rangeli]RNF10427.1 glycoside hydrolase family protein [Trypanosoma rangeli]|eukprot:RNF10427.1 glycoside hydrolase family protein [Trypanosoma rangeli]